MNVREIVLPELPPVGDCVLARWSKREGESFERGELLAEIESEKALMEWRADAPGVLLEQLVKERDVLESSMPMARIEARVGDRPSVATLIYVRIGR